MFFRLLLPCLLAVAVHADHNANVTFISSTCSTHCDVTHDPDLSCFNRTLRFYEEAIAGMMRQYVSSQADLQQLRLNLNRPPLSKDDLIKDAEDNIDTVEAWYIEDGKKMFPAKLAIKVMDILIDSAQLLSPLAAPLVLVCPAGCEESTRVWLALFLASAALNVVAGFFAIVYVMYMVSRNEKQSKEALKASLKGELEKLAKTRPQPFRTEEMDGDDDGHSERKESMKRKFSSFASSSKASSENGLPMPTRKGSRKANGDRNEPSENVTRF